MVRPSARSVVREHADAVGLLHAQLPGVTHLEPTVGERAGEREHRELVEAAHDERPVDLVQRSRSRARRDVADRLAADLAQARRR
jgi:hypothetical protein